MTPDRWQALMRQFEFRDEFPEMYRRLEDAYSEPQRHYHTADHIAECLAEFDAVRHLAESPALVEAALWFHDAVYDSHASDNERRSAALATRFFTSNGVPGPQCVRLHAHIMATLHRTEPSDVDARLVVDIDIAILGRDEATYDAFERAVREEYRWVPAMIYRQKRAKVLRAFLDRPSVYATPAFRAEYEYAARNNLERTIAALEAGEP